VKIHKRRNQKIFEGKKTVPAIGKPGDTRGVARTKEMARGLEFLTKGGGGLGVIEKKVMFGGKIFDRQSRKEKKIKGVTPIVRRLWQLGECKTI